MRQRITAYALRYGTRCHRIGDFVFYPGTIHPGKIGRIVDRAIARGCYPEELAPFAEQIRGDKWSGFPRVGFFGALQAAYERYAYEDDRDDAPDARIPAKDPDWCRHMPRPLLGELQANLAVQGHYGDIWNICPFALTGANFVVTDGGLTEATIRCFHLFRLSGVRQLGNLSRPVLKGFPDLSIRFHHTRYGHSVDAAALMLLMMRNNGVNETEARNALVAVLCHDALTPAHGDGTKLLDPAAFDEDAHFEELFMAPGWPTLAKRFYLDRDAISRVVQEEGPLGELKDLADKIAYTARDVTAYFYPGEQTPFNATDPEGWHAIRACAEKRRFICGLWDGIRIHRGRVVCSDVARMADFLRLRALMHRHLYWNPMARYREFIVSTVILRYLFEKGILSRDDLLKMSDDDADRAVSALLGKDSAIDWIDIVGQPRVEVFDDLLAAQARERELHATGVVYTFPEVLARPIKTGTHFLVRTKNGVCTVAEAMPDLEAEIREIVRLPRYRLYYSTAPSPLASFNDAYAAYFVNRWRSTTDRERARADASFSRSYPP